MSVSKRWGMVSCYGMAILWTTRETLPPQKRVDPEFMSVRLPIKHFICNILFCLHNNPWNSHFIDEDPGDLSKVTRLVNGVMIRFEFYGPQIHSLIQLHSLANGCQSCVYCWLSHGDLIWDDISSHRYEETHVIVKANICKCQTKWPLKENKLPVFSDDSSELKSTHQDSGYMFNSS